MALKSRGTEGHRKFPVNPNRESAKRRGAAEGMPYPTRIANGKEKRECGEPAKGALSELSRSGAQNGRDGLLPISSTLPAATPSRRPTERRSRGPS